MKKKSTLLLALLMVALAGIQAQQNPFSNKRQVNYTNGQVVLQPEISFEPEELIETHAYPGQITTRQLTVFNPGTSPLSFYIDFMGSDLNFGENVGENKAQQSDPNSELAPGSYFGNKVINSDADFDLQFEFPCGDGSGEAGIETDGNFFYTTKWNGSGFFKYHIDGTFLGAFQVGTVTAIRDLAYDGTYFYGGAAATTVYKMDFNTNTLIGQFTAPVVVRAIAYDEGEDGFWANNWSTTLTLFNQSGAVLNTIPTNGDESFYGLAYDLQGPYLWGYSQRAGTSQNILYKYAMPDGQFLLEFDVLPLLSYPVLSDIAGGLAFHPDLVQGTYTILGIVQNKSIWGLEMGPYGPPLNVDVGVQMIVYPITGCNLGNEQVVIKIKNFGIAPQSNIPWTVAWSGESSGSFYGTYAGPLAAGAEVNITVGTANLMAYGTYNFEACTNLTGDENLGNNCKNKAVMNTCSFPCVDNLYTSGCSFDDGLTSWNLQNITIPNIPCAGTPPWYQNYMNQIHYLEPGVTYLLTVTAGYADTYFDVWIDFDKNWEYTNDDELVLNDGYCHEAATVYTFWITIPEEIADGEYLMRFRTNRQNPVYDACWTYDYGNCADFKVLIEDYSGWDWIAAEPLSGTIPPGGSQVIDVTFNSVGATFPDVFTGDLIFYSSAPGSPHLVPATLICETAAPSIVIDPMEVTFYWSGAPQMLTDTILVTNEGSEPLTYDIFVMQLPGAGPDVVVDPEFVSVQYALRAALEGDPNSERAPGSYFGNKVINSDADFDLQFEYACGDASGEAGIETDGNFFYTTKWNGSGFFKYHIDGTFLGAFQVGTVNGIRDLAYDGTYFYGGAAATTVYKMDFNTNTLIGQFTAPVAVRAIAYDEYENGFWANNWSTTLTLFNQSGTVLNTIPTYGNESFYGFAFDPQGPYLWGYSQNGFSQNILYKYALPSGELLLEFDVFPLLSLVATGDVAGGLAFHIGIVPQTLSLVGLVQNKCIWGLEMGYWWVPPNIDVGVQSIISPTSGVSLGIEPVVIRIKNYGELPQTNIPWTVTYSGQGVGSFSGIYAGSLAPGEDVEISAGTIDMSAYGTYIFEACTNLEGDENPENDCKTKAITYLEPSLCVDNLYTSGCSFGDGLTSWNLENINIANIPCAGNPPWYQNYMDQIHELYVGETYVLSVTAGYANTYFDVWIDFDNDLEFNNNNELVLNDALCTEVGTVYTFNITIPPAAPAEPCAMRVRTNWTAPVLGACDTYTYGNCIDFKAYIGWYFNPWLTVEPNSGTIAPGASTQIAVSFNSNYYGGGEGLLYFHSNDPINGIVEVPVYVVPDPGCPYPFPENLDLSIIYGDTTFATVTWELNTLQQFSRIDIGSTTRQDKSGELLGFDILRNDTLIATLIQGFTYTDTIMTYYPACYKIAAHYDDCTAISEEIVCIPVSVDEITGKSEVKVYPNPAKDLLNVSAQGMIEITIQTISGKLIYNQIVDNDHLQINTSTFNKGIYLITIRTDQTTHTEKLIIQ